MDEPNGEWNNWEVGDSGDLSSVPEPLHKPEDGSSIVSGESIKSEMIYENSNMEGDDSAFQFEGDFESLEEMSESLSDDDDDEQKLSIERSPYRFMNGNDGMATCERCGSVGIKHAFYSKSKRFCSLACSRATGDMPLPRVALKKQMPGKKQKSGKVARHRNKPSSSKPGGVRSFDWGSYIISSNAEGVPVSCFKHVPMSDCWDNISIGMKVEVENRDCDLPNTVYWIATVMKLAGYQALLRYEGFGSDGHKDFWINLCHKDVHPVGWCATSGKPLVPPKTIQHKYLDWKDYLVKRLTGSRTLPSNFYTKVQDNIHNHKFRKATHVEVVDRMCVSAMRVAKVEEVIGGRLRLQYDDAKEEGDEFWCHMKSPLIHPVGWAQQVGHKLHASQEYKSQCLGKTTMQKYDARDATPDMFAKMKTPPEGFKFQVGMKLEAIDPLNLSAICVATVMKVLKNNYLMIGIDGSEAQIGTDWFCYHATSPCIFPVGFCEVNGLSLTPPRDYKTPFKWFDYLKQTRSVAAPVKLFDKEIPKHGFKAGSKLEAVDLMEPRLICVATVAKVVGRLLRIHFDGWESEYDQWVDCESADLYPIGWCSVMNYNVEGPRLKTEVPNAPPQPQPIPKKRKGKTQIYKGPRKKRKPKMPMTPPPSVKSMSSQFDIMRHRLLNTRTEEVSERAQEVPHITEFSALRHHQPPITIKKEPVDHEVPSVSTPGASPSQAAPGHSTLAATLAAPHNPISASLLQDVKPIINSSPSPQRPAQNLAAGMPTTTVKSELLERITSGSLVSSSGQISLGPQSNLLAGHLTGTLPLTGNSALVSTAAPPKPSQTQAGNQTQSKPVTSGGQLQPETQTLYLTQRHQTLAPSQWNVIDVCHFLKYNECRAYVEIFHRKNISGEQFMALTKEQIASLTGMKVGSSLKIFELIQVLKNKMAVQKMQQKALSVQ